MALGVEVRTTCKRVGARGHRGGVADLEAGSSRGVTGLTEKLVVSAGEPACDGQGDGSANPCTGQPRPGTGALSGAQTFDGRGVASRV